MRKSKVWNFSSKDFAKFVQDSETWADLRRKCGYTHPSSYKVLRERVKSEGLDTKHFLGQSWRKGKSMPRKKIPLEEILIINFSYNSNSLKRRLLNKDILKYECSGCKLTEWLGNPITLELDHINGNRLDNRLENLRLLCPNCHSYTNTYKGKNVKRPPIQVYKCKDCSTKIGKGSIKCVKCTNKKYIKFTCTKEELYELIHMKKIPYTRIGKMYGVTDNAIRKRAIKLGIPIRRVKKVHM